MYETKFPAWLKCAILALSIVVLGACHRGEDIKKNTTDAGAVPAQYDLSLLADKDGQYELDGATLNVEDLRGHIRYLNESGHPVKTIFLKRGEKQKVVEAHILGLAGISRDLKVQAYVEIDDRLKLIQIDDEGKK